MSQPIPFRLTIGSKVLVVAALSLATAEAHARDLAAADFSYEVKNLPMADYAKTDFSTVTRVEGGKDDAAVYPFVISLNGEETVKFATSPALAEKHVNDLIKEKGAFTVEQIPFSEYGEIDWSSVETLAEPEKSKRGRKSNAEKAAAAAEGDAGKQTEMAGIPGMDD